MALTLDVSCLHTAIRQGNMETIQQCVTAGVDVNALLEGYRAIHLAVIAYQTDPLRTLLQNNATPDLRDTRGWTALHYACNPANEDAIDILLEFSADPNLTTEDGVYRVNGRIPVYMTGGRTPLHWAVDNGDSEAITALFKSKNIKKDIVDNDGNSPLDLAQMGGKQVMVDAIAGQSTELWGEEKRTKWTDESMKRQRTRMQEKEIADDAIQALKIKVGATGYLPLHPELLTFTDQIFTPTFQSALRSTTTTDLHSIGEEVSPGVWAFHLLTDEFCQSFAEEAENYATSGLPVRRPNSMNNYGVVLDDFGFFPFFQELRQRVLQKLADVFLPNATSTPLVTHHAFTVKYKLGEDLDLDEHIDNSHVTLNVCLGKEFEGGTLYFRLKEEVEGEDVRYGRYVHRPGWGLLHRGDLYHGADHITGGERCNLIVWCKEIRP